MLWMLLFWMTTVGCKREAATIDKELTSSSTAPLVVEASLEEQLAAIEAGETFEVRLRQTPLQPEDCPRLLAVAGRLRVLEMNRSELSPQALGDLLLKLPELRQLVLWGEVDTASLEVIVAAVPRLKVLNLPEGVFDNAGLSLLAELRELELLRFQSPHVDDAGLTELSRLPELRFLHLIDVPITDAGLPAIAALERLRSFYLDGGACTEEGLSELIRQSPRLHFHWNQLHLRSDPQRTRHQH